MNEIIKKWNDEIISVSDRGDAISGKRYVTENNMRIIDLKYLTEINKDTMGKNVNNIIEEKLKTTNGDMCLYNLGEISNEECKSYSMCFLCKLNYLISIDRIKIIKIQEGSNK